ncbi:hypothetical protein [Thalassococcus sp. S3]|uniref:hypothetical protein n=1 Tax=Thalassococcus sp. S3 TaxID=2017482 RepID=UPI00102BA87B|nr:hypothetical protein [Thalassococcus sp. S3]
MQKEELQRVSSSISTLARIDSRGSENRVTDKAFLLIANRSSGGSLLRFSDQKTSSSRMSVFT